jgi:hypothetical protein
VSWDPITASNVISVGGSTLTDVPILNTAEAGLLAPGDVVGLLSTGEGARSFWILGRITVPGTPQAGTALSAWAGRGKLATADGLYLFGDTSFAPASDGSGPTITNFAVGNSGQALVFISAQVNNPGGPIDTAAFREAYFSFQLSGPTNIGPSVDRSLGVGADWSSSSAIAIGAESNATRMVPLIGLVPGIYTIDARYQINAGAAGGTATVQRRSLFAVPI